MSDNQQVTKRLNFLVGTSETIRPLSFFPLIIIIITIVLKIKLEMWLAGLIDGDGSLLVSLAIAAVK